MEWFGNNWVWLALAAGFAFVVLRGGGCGMGHGGHGRQQGAPEDRGPEHAHHAGVAGQGGEQQHRHGCH